MSQSRKGVLLDQEPTVKYLPKRVMGVGLAFKPAEQVWKYEVRGLTAKILFVGKTISGTCMIILIELVGNTEDVWPG